ncbi:ATP synthase F1 subunit delta [bacterium]|nr:ATP synthase F1 subunit delta [bacterium]
MTNSVAAKEYAKALFLLARRTDRIEVIAGDFEAFIHILETDPKLRLFLLAPQISAEKKGQVFRDALGGKVDDNFLRFLLVVFEKRRHDLLEEINVAYHEELDRYYDRVEVAAATAVEMTESENSALSAKLAGRLGKKIVLRTKVDPRLLGGLVCRIGDVVYDGSLRRRIDRLYHQMLKAQ